jgi:hypothetical protein
MQQINAYDSVEQTEETCIYENDMTEIKHIFNDFDMGMLKAEYVSSVVIDEAFQRGPEKLPSFSG